MAPPTEIMAPVWAPYGNYGPFPVEGLLRHGKHGSPTELTAQGLCQTVQSGQHLASGRDRGCSTGALPYGNCAAPYGNYGSLSQPPTEIMGHFPSPLRKLWVTFPAPYGNFGSLFRPPTEMMGHFLAPYGNYGLLFRTSTEMMDHLCSLLWQLRMTFESFQTQTEDHSRQDSASHCTRHYKFLGILPIRAHLTSNQCERGSACRTQCVI